MFAVDFACGGGLDGGGVSAGSDVVYVSRGVAARCLDDSERAGGGGVGAACDDAGEDFCACVLCAQKCENAGEGSGDFAGVHAVV